MSPKQDLEQLIVPETEGASGTADGEALTSELDGAQVVVVPKTVNSHQVVFGKGKQKDKCMGGGGKLGKKGPEMPKNCPHLETALFFFGIAGMIISLIMLLLHCLRKITPFY